jgi:hypothetical protein
MEVLSTIRSERSLSFEERKYLFWGLQRLLQNANDPFNLNKSKLKGDIAGPVTKEEIRWQSYLSVKEFVDNGYPLTPSKKMSVDQSTATEKAAEFLRHDFNLELKPETVETYYKQVLASILRAEAVIAELERLKPPTNTGIYLEEALEAAALSLKENKTIDNSIDKLRDAYSKYHHLLLEDVSSPE